MWLLGYLSSLLDLFLLGVPLLHVPHEEALAQELLGAAARLDVQQGVVGVLDHALPEGTDAQLHHGSVVQDLRWRTRRAFSSIKSNERHSADIRLTVFVCVFVRSKGVCVCVCVCV